MVGRFNFKVTIGSYKRLIAELICGAVRSKNRYMAGGIFCKAKYHY